MISLRRRAIGILLRAALAAALLLGALLTALWIEHAAMLELPRPTGTFAAGRLDAVWTDSSRNDPFAPQSSQLRQLAVWLWYPADTTAPVTKAPYLPPRWSAALAQHSGLLLSTFLTRSPAKVVGASLEAPPLASDSSSYPVVVLRSGIGALALDYSTLAEDLASHGYLVVGADAPYSTSVVAFPDGRVLHKSTAGNPGDASLPPAEQDRLLDALLEVWTADTKFLVDRLAQLSAGDPDGRFTGRIDMAALGVAGHSFGGATALQFCRGDRRCRAAVNIDGAPYGQVAERGLDTPALFLLADHSAEWSSASCTICAKIRRAAANQPDNKLIVTLRGAYHFSFSDQALTKSQFLLGALRAMGIVGSLDGRRGLGLSSQYLRGFYAVHLRGRQPQPLYSAPLAPEARLESR